MSPISRCLILFAVTAAHSFKLTPFGIDFSSQDNHINPLSPLEDAVDPDAKRNTAELIEARGFRAENHYVTTKDGYILEIFRIINPHLPPSNNRSVLMLQHGLLSSSAGFILNSREVDWSGKTVGNNLGFALSVRGYDVWLTNSRGNVYGTNHTTLNPKHDRAFWKFSWDEMAEYDLPATISYILSETGKQSLGYIGHSQGTTIMFALLSSQPQYADIVKPFIALAPIATVKNTKSPIRIIAENHVILDFFYLLGGDFLPSNGFMQYLAQISCGAKDKGAFLCYNIIFLLCGFDIDEMNKDRLPVFVSHNPAGTSSWDLVHWAQSVNSGNFQKFDYGPFYNHEKYGTLTPPKYDLGRITSKNIALLHSENDYLADPTDVTSLKRSLRVPILSDYNVPDPKWNHLDFLIGKDVGVMVNTEVVRILAMKEW